MILMNRKLVITFSLLAILGFGLAGQTLAQTASGKSGVMRGDYLIYSITSHWSTTNSSLTVPDELLRYNDTLRYNVTVESVQGGDQGSIIAILNNLVFTNGTDLTAPSYSNIDSGELISYIPGYPAFEGIYDANLVVNNLLHPSGNDSLTISQTITRDYYSGKRDTNVVITSDPIKDINNKTGTQTISTYIDKSKGVLVESNSDIRFADYNASIIWTLKDTNLWTVSAVPLPPLPLPLPVIIAIVVVVIAVVAVLVFYRERNLGRKKHRH
jgi:hypothetical protein